MTTSRKPSNKSGDDEDTKLPPIKRKPAPAKHSPRPALPTIISPARASRPSSTPTLAGMSISTASESTKGNPSPVVGKGLLAFGLRPASTSFGSFLDKDSTLKCCVIHGPTTSALVFRVQPNDIVRNLGGSWGEKCFFEAVRLKKQWVLDIGVDNTCLSWYHDNIEQKNPKGYAIRLFVIKVEGPPPTKDVIVDIGNYICRHINDADNNKTTTKIEEASFFWLPDDAVWSDIIGYDAALAALIRDAGPPCDGYYDLHWATILSYFEAGSFSLELARTLRAPNEQIHPSERPH